MTQYGQIYFLVNLAMPGLVKVGRTSVSVEERMRQLSTTGTPQPFQAAAIFYVSDPAACEKAVHKALDSCRPNKSREFFQGSVSDLVRLSLPVLEGFMGTPDVAASKSADMHAIDDDDIYFLTFLLHDGYQEGALLSSGDLAEHHLAYAPLELEYKLLKLAEIGMVERDPKRIRGELSLWRMTPKGLIFMFENGHVLQDVIAGSRSTS